MSRRPEGDSGGEIRSGPLWLSGTIAQRRRKKPITPPPDLQNKQQQIK